MVNVVVLFIGVALLFYILLGGADFGAGILEIFTGRRGKDTISDAIAPVWEANHIWLIVVIVILFNAFPSVYSTATSLLHIPLLFVLLGIIFRGTAFTFRYYDPFVDKTHKYYTFFFKLFSLLTPFFLGVTLGAVILGRITVSESAGFVEKFISPWFTLFSLTLGIFITILFGFLAAIYLIGEAKEEKSQKMFVTLSKRLLVALILGGLLVFAGGEFDGLQLLKLFLQSHISIICIVLATLLLPLLWISFKHPGSIWTRVIAGTQTTAILIGWFGVQFPVLVKLKDTPSLTVYNSVAPDKVLGLLVAALVVGLLIVIPLLIYLIYVFKFKKDINKS